MLLGMQDFDFAQILITFAKICPTLPKSRPNFFLEDAAMSLASSAPTKLIPTH